MMMFYEDEEKNWELLNKCLMGPNAVKVVEELTDGLPLARGMRVLDMGCGTGLTSMFLAKRFDVTVFANDLWIDPTENFRRFREFGLEDAVYPIRAEAHALPYAHGFFDAAVSVDSYHYYGVEEDYLAAHFAPLLKPGGLLAVAVPGLQREFENGTPEELVPLLPEDANFHSCAWWTDLWARSGVVEDVRAVEMACCAEAWADWLRCDNPYAKGDIAMMEAEGGRYFNIVKLLARTKG